MQESDLVFFITNYCGRQLARSGHKLGRISGEMRAVEGISATAGLEHSKPLILNGFVGRRDWIRTNDPHHVKVVL